MKKMLLFVLTLAGLSAVSARILTEYFYVNKPLPWHEARRYCRDKFTELVPVTSYNINSRMQNLINGVTQPVWIGLHDDMRKWVWSLGDQHHLSDRDFQNWLSGEPDNRHSSENCTLINAHGYWVDAPCMDQYPVVCFQQTGPVKYKYVETLMTWRKARAYCRSKHTDLASILNRGHQNQIQPLLTYQAWIGLHRLTWSSWSNGRSTNFTNWHTGQPDDGASCAVINATTGTWWDVPCEANYSFICFKWSVVPDAVSIHHKIRFQSEADLKDPALQQQVLEQLHAKLKEHGLPDYKLRWLHTDEQTYNWQQEKNEEGSGA